MGGGSYLPVVLILWFFMVGRVGTIVQVGGYSLGSFLAHLVYLDQ